MKLADLSSLALRTLQKKYGGKIETHTWTATVGTLLDRPVNAMVYRPGRVAHISLFWDGILLRLFDDIDIPASAHPTKVRWFMKYLETMGPELKELAPKLYELAETHEKTFKTV